MISLEKDRNMIPITHVYTKTPRDSGKSLYINNEPSFLLEENRYNKDNVLFNEKKAWAFSEGVFKIIYFDNVIKLENKNIINPIDTLPSNNEFSGNFENNAKN